MLNKEKNLYKGTATNATSKLVEHIGSKKGGEMIELIELATLISQLGNEIKKLEKNIETAQSIKEKNELIYVYNKAIDELSKAHELQAKKTKKEWNHVLPFKKDLIKEVEEQKIENKTLEEKPAVQQTPTDEKIEKEVAVEQKDNVVVNSSGVIEEIPPEGKPSAQLVNKQNERGDPNTIGSSSVILGTNEKLNNEEEQIPKEEIKTENGSQKNIDTTRLVQLSSDIRNLMIKKDGLYRYINNNILEGGVKKEKIEEYNLLIDEILDKQREQESISGRVWNHGPLIKIEFSTDKKQAEKQEEGFVISENNILDSDEGDVGKTNPENKEDLMEQLKIQMESMLEVEKRIQELKEENLELEKFIAEQEEKEKGEILKEEALKVLKQGKKAGIKRNDPKLNIFKKEWVEEVYGKDK